MLQPVFSRLQIERVQKGAKPVPEYLANLKGTDGKSFEIVQGNGKEVKEWSVWKIVAVGPEAGYRDGRLVQSFEAGDEIVVHENHVQPIEFEGKKYHFLKNDVDVLAIYKKGAK